MPEIRSILQKRHRCLEKNEIAFPLMTQRTTDTVVPARTCVRVVCMYVCGCVSHRKCCEIVQYIFTKFHTHAITELNCLF